MSDDEVQRHTPEASEETSDDNSASASFDEDVTEARSGLIDTFTAGGRLKEARLQQGRSQEDIATELKVSPRVIENLEQTIQPPEYDMRRTRLLAKSYAKMLGVDPAFVMADFPMDEEQELATAVPKSSATIGEGRASRYLVPVTAVAGAVLAVGISFVMLKPGEIATTRQDAPSVAERVVAVNTAQESLFAEEPLSTRPEKAMQLAIVATEPAWIEIRGADGTIFRSRVMAEGEKYYPRVDAGWTVTAQDGSAFEWRVDGEFVGRLSQKDQPVYSASIDEAATLAAERKTPSLAATSNSRPAR
ncbi:RodZ domain-containing protein [Henriciella sp.]|uniref:helix-turn-helix domain-containing protein n=1 Tax=Henriciella sp. TaxID=1968823 RepID=UPI0026328C7D|nr:RodZ domain-containing protein [Henriciella sp.]